MWISISLSKSLSSLSFYINYVICEFWLYVFDWCFGAAFYINYVICESKGRLPSILYIGQVLYKLCDMWIFIIRRTSSNTNTVLYKLCDMWMGVVKILQNELGEFYINYVICELSWVLSHMIQTVRFYINYVICESQFS